ncbi:hypothetical protein ANCCAN_08098 [Ancylostoma caninum]|uniref:Uncharacterized protein n=1 Tax=Ancylostoma caninum TaxID=29170 RepID=A0A368GNI2_ANCCA|nr:hypothetical protein ANCCAN_08098 [Ancylostoma caninum]
MFFYPRQRAFDDGPADKCTFIGISQASWTVISFEPILVTGLSTAYMGLETGSHLKRQGEKNDHE